MVSRMRWGSVFRLRTLIKVQFITLPFYSDAFVDRQRIRKNERFRIIWDA